MKTNILLISILCLATAQKATAKERELIQSIQLEKHFLKIRLHNSIQEKYLKEDFFAQYDQDIDLTTLDYEIITMPVIMNVIAIIWISGNTFYIDSMDEELYQSLKTIKKLIKAIHPNTNWDGELIARKTVSLAAKYNHIHKDNRKRAVLFSGGLDSTSSFFHHVQEDLMTITAWGAYDLPLDQQHIWEDRKQKTINFTKTYNHTSSFLKSNYYDFLNLAVLNNLTSDIDSWRLGAIEGLGWAGLTAPILASKGCSLLYIPSSLNWYLPYAEIDNPFVDNSVQFAGFRLSHDQFDCARFGKNECIVRACKENNFQKPFIKVCQWTQESDDINCCNCRKCLTTIMGFLALEEKPEDYGFPVSPRQAVKRFLALLIDKDRRGQYDIEQFYIIQKYMRKQKALGKKFLKELDPFLTYDLGKAKIKTRKEVRRIDWRVLHKIAPVLNLPQDLS